MSVFERFRARVNTSRIERPPLENFEGRVGQLDWAGLWELEREDMRWWRDQHYYMKSASSNRVEQFTQKHRGPGVRPGPLSTVESLRVPLAVLRSHPDAPGSLPEHREGQWTDTNPAWPEISIDTILGRLSLVAVWEETDPDFVETYDLVPSVVEGINPDETVQFSRKPLKLSAPVIYARPGTPPQRWDIAVQPVDPDVPLQPFEASFGPMP